MRLSTFLPCCKACAALMLAGAVAVAGFGFAQQNILDDPSRPPEERARDAGTKPVQLYAFWGIESGMTVADMMPGGGYNTYILTRLVGPSGKVYTGPDRRGAMAARLASNPLANATLIASYDEMPAGSVDVIITVRNMHDLMLRGGEAAALAAWMTALKPGGILGIVDARTPKAGADGDTHRVNQQAVIDAVTAAGFEFVEASEMLANASDDFDAMSETGNRYEIDRMTLKFRKPAM
jgi:predicted methyltransferase